MNISEFDKFCRERKMEMKAVISELIYGRYNLEQSSKSHKEEKVTQMQCYNRICCFKIMIGMPIYSKEITMIDH
jgi:hypothetical protein